MINPRAIPSKVISNAPPPSRKSSVRLRLSLQQFLKALADSHLLSTAELAAIDAEVARNEIPSTDALVERLTGTDQLTSFQASALARGSAAPLVYGDYVVLSEVATGSTARIYRARHRPSGRTVALKIPTVESSLHPESMERFRREVAALSQLEHSNVVRVIEAVQHDDLNYLALEYIHGPNLEDYIQSKGAFSPAMALDCLIQVAQGLEYIHSLQMVHRDIKPNNLLVNSDGTIKIIDFGTVRFRDFSPIGKSLGTRYSMLTRRELILGTPHYMAPEQILSAHDVDGRCDMYSLGCTFYFLLTAARPFERANARATLEAHRSEPPPLLQTTCASIPDAWQQVFAKLVAKDRSDRYPSMSEAIVALKALSHR